MGMLDASRSRPVKCWKRYCEFSTQVRNGTCCRKAIRTAKLCIDAFDPLTPGKRLGLTGTARADRARRLH